MEVRRGMPVISKAGHDKGSWYIVYNIEGNLVKIVNGTNRTMENPKTKKLKHLQPVNEILLEKETWTNEEVKRALKLAKQD